MDEQAGALQGCQTKKHLRRRRQAVAFYPATLRYYLPENAPTAQPECLAAMDEAPGWQPLLD